MLKRDYYPVQTIADTLKCTIEYLRYLAAKGELPIYVLTSHFIQTQLQSEVMALFSGDVQPGEQMTSSHRLLRLSDNCLRNWESKGDDAELEIKHKIIFDDETGRPIERHRFNLQHCDKKEQPTIKDCTLVVLEEDLKRLQNPTPRNENLSDEGVIRPRTGHYEQRDIIAIKLVKDNPKLLSMRKDAIKKELIVVTGFQVAGFDDWWRLNPVFPKSKQGRTKNC